MLSLWWLELENKENEARTKCCCVCSHSALAGPFSEIEQHAEYEVETGIPILSGFIRKRKYL